MTENFWFRTTSASILNGTQILAELWSNGTTIVYIYDAEGSPFGMLYRESTYAKGAFDVFWFERNLQGDVIAVYDNAGTKLITYTYDAWGNVTTTYSNGGASTGAVNNPFKYRGYYHDSETGFYYLNSRYYDPVICRFLNADGYVSTGQGLTGYNMFAYCGNNPVSRLDKNGYGWSDFWKKAKLKAEMILSSIINKFEECIGIVVSTESKSVVESYSGLLGGYESGGYTSAAFGERDENLIVEIEMESNNEVCSLNPQMVFQFNNASGEVYVGTDIKGITLGVSKNGVSIELQLGLSKIAVEAKQGVIRNGKEVGGYQNVYINPIPCFIAAFTIFAVPQLIPS